MLQVKTGEVNQGQMIAKLFIEWLLQCRINPTSSHVIFFKVTQTIKGLDIVFLKKYL